MDLAPDLRREQQFLRRAGGVDDERDVDRRDVEDVVQLGLRPGGKRQRIEGDGRRLEHLLRDKSRGRQRVRDADLRVEPEAALELRGVGQHVHERRLGRGRRRQERKVVVQRKIHGQSVAVQGGGKGAGVAPSLILPRCTVPVLIRRVDFNIVSTSCHVIEHGLVCSRRFNRRSKQDQFQRGCPVERIVL